jgi:hypothetical protein
VLLQRQPVLNFLGHFLAEYYHDFDLGLQDDIVLDDSLVEVYHHVLADHHLPFASIFLLNRLFQS